MKQRKPAWFILYAFVFLMLGALVLESFDGLPDWANEVVTVGIIGVIFGAMILWMRANAHALWNEELEKTGLEEYRIEVISPQPSSDDAGNTKVRSDLPSTHYVLRRNKKGNFYAFRTTPRDSGTRTDDDHYGIGVPTSGYRSRANRFSESVER